MSNMTAGRNNDRQTDAATAMLIRMRRTEGISVRANVMMFDRPPPPPPENKTR